MKKKGGSRNIGRDFAYEFTREKLEEFRFMSAEARLQWLEEANNFICKFVKKGKRARWDERIK